MFSTRATGCRLAAAVLGILFVAPMFGLAMQSPADDQDPSTETCSECHRLDPVLSHPVRIKPSMLVPDGLPLFDGQVTCRTCHDISGPQHTQNHDPQLRQPAELLCRACHQGAMSANGTGHGANIGRAHLPKSSAAITNADGLDAESRNCITCHDGSVAAEATTVSSRNPLALPTEHPIGTLYDRPAGSTKLIPQPALNPRVRLIEGKVGCTSCHSPYSTEKAQLVMPNRHSALCLSCHQM